MIEQVLDKRFLNVVLEGMQQNAAVISRNDDDDDRRRGAVAPAPLDAAAAHTLSNDLDAARRAAVVVHASAAPETPARPNPDFSVFISGSPELSNLQSAINEYCAVKRPDLLATDTAAPPGRDDDRRRGAASDAPITGTRLKNWSAPTPGAEARRLFGPFEQTDIRWINSWFAEAMTKFRGKHPFVPRPTRSTPIELPDDNLRLFVFADWGSGIPRAVNVAQAMRRELLAGKAQGLCQHVIHLGDVYYSGWKKEYQDRLLKDWPVTAAEQDSIGSFNLNGNHDMFSGGHALYDYALADPRFHLQGQSTLCHLANSRWQLFALDTAWDDAALTGDQPQWVLGAAAMRKDKPGEKKKTILLSHHQYCSSYEKVSAGVTGPIEPVLRQLDVAAWLWGHEHRCESYQPVAGIRSPICIGHAGVPVYQFHGQGDPLPAPGQWEYRDSLYEGLEPWAKFGYVTLDFHGDTIHVRYINEDGKEHHTQTIV